MRFFYFLVFGIIFIIACGNPNKPKLSYAGYLDFDLNESLEISKKTGKPVLLYFSSWGCAGCRIMETDILDHPSVTEVISRDFMFAPLYTDDRTNLPKDQWRGSKHGNRIMKKVGSVYSELQIDLTKSGSQPLFVIVDSDKRVVKEVGYTKSVNEFESFLKTIKDKD